MELKPLKRLSSLLIIPAFVSKRQINRLKCDGIRYEGEIVGFVGSDMTGHYAKGDFASATRVEVAYTNQQGERRLVRSKLLLMRMGDGKDNLTAMVYVDRSDPAKYQLEVFRVTNK
ncbi:MAG: hypothetical protein FWD97_04910 [Defluviitaleaceae bacterium]|nr:hypothetical protein [Defluviitaleaceae bacterium]